MHIFWLKKRNALRRTYATQTDVLDSFIFVLFLNESHFPFPGLRKCPADDLAQMEVFLVLTNLLQAFSFRAPSGDNGAIGTFYKAGTSVLRNPKPFYVVMQNRK